MMKIILEVENTNYLLRFSYHLFSFHFKRRGWKNGVAFSSLFQTSKFLETPICCWIFHFTIPKERMCSLKLHWSWFNFHPLGEGVIFHLLEWWCQHLQHRSIQSCQDSGCSQQWNTMKTQCYFPATLEPLCICYWETKPPEQMVDLCRVYH